MLAEARRLLTEANDLPHLVEVIHTIGFGDWAKGRLNDAIAVWEDAVAIARSIPDPAREARLQLQIARAHALAGRLPIGHRTAPARRGSRRAVGDRRTRLDSARCRVAWIVASTSASEAAAAFASLIPEIEEMGDHELLEALISQMGEQLYRAGDVAGARAAMERALEISEAAGHAGRIPEVAADLAEVLVEIGDVDGAERHAVRAVETAGDWDVTARAVCPCCAGNGPCGTGQARRGGDAHARRCLARRRYRVRRHAPRCDDAAGVPPPGGRSGRRRGMGRTCHRLRQGMG